MKLDILAIGAHPDDVELGCSGTLAKEIHQGKSVGILDLTRGELGTRGSAEIRDKESAAAAKILNIKVRENLSFADGFFINDKHHQIENFQIVLLLLQILCLRFFVLFFLLDHQIVILLL